MQERHSRRDFHRVATAALAVSTVAASPSRETSTLTAAETDGPFQLRYLLGSCLYGYADSATIAAEVRKTGATAIDLWPKVHGNQREQLDEMGEFAFAELLDQHDIRLGCLTQYKLGPFGLHDEIELAGRFRCPVIVTGGKGPKGLTGGELKSAVSDFVEKMKPHVEQAAQAGVTIAIENHGNNLIESPDSLLWLAEMAPSSGLSIALAPYHLPQDPQVIAGLIEKLGNSISVFYAWQHGKGSMQKQPKEDERLQMPGRGELDFEPLVKSLKKIRFNGWTEIFMHPYPRGLPIVNSVSGVTDEINRSRRYLDSFLAAS